MSYTNYRGKKVKNYGRTKFPRNNKVWKQEEIPQRIGMRASYKGLKEWRPSIGDSLLTKEIKQLKLKAIRAERKLRH